MSTPDLFASLDDESREELGTASHSLPGKRPTPEQSSLYRKFRPQTFDPDDLVGQEAIVQTLRNAVRRDRVAHAYLFCGPRGTGKTTTARLLAKAVNCLDENPGNRPCNHCDACIAITNGSAIDVVEIDAASNRGIDDIRELRDRVRFVPTSLRTKVYIIDEAHQITGAAANAFLKTLEEPPAHTRFILATTDPEQLLPTIVSRCQRFDFRRIPTAVAVDHLRNIAKTEAIVVEDEALHLIAEQSGGSLRDALGLLDQLSIFGDQSNPSERTVRAEDVRALLGIARSDVVEQLVEAIAAKDTALALTLLNDAVDRGEDARQINRQLIEMFRQVLMLQVTGAKASTEDLQKTSRLFTAQEAVAMARHFSAIDFRGRALPVPHLPLEIALAQVCLAAPAASAVEVASPAAQRPAPPPRPLRPVEQETVAPAPAAPRPSLVERASSRGNRPRESEPTRQQPPVPETPDPKQPAAASESSITVDDLNARWSDVRAEVKALSRRIEALLTSVNPVDVRGSTIVLASAYPFHRDKLSEPDVRTLVEQVIGGLFGRAVTVQVEMHADVANSDNGNGVSKTAPSPARLPDQSQKAVDMAKRIFDADVVDD